MGINNRQRRAAKRRKRTEQHRSQASAAGWSCGWSAEPPAAYDPWLRVALLVEHFLAEPDSDTTAPARYAQLLTGPESPVPLAVTTSYLHRVLRDLVPAVLRAGWLPSDLAEITGRRLAAGHLPALADLLAAEAHRHPTERVAPAWRTDLAGLGAPARADLATAQGLETTLGLLSLLVALPTITTLVPPPGAARQPAGPLSGVDEKVLSRVRALLAKAESTTYEEEAEALSAKAQELISRYALDRLEHRLRPDGASTEEAVTSRRMWIDAPYVLAKAMLVGAVAEANRCRTVVSDQLGFVTILGGAGDLDAVELLSTSLLVQANGAMLRCGRQDGRFGSRTTSFRRSFLIAYAMRIGERLRAVTAEATTEAGRSSALVPLLARHAERVEQFRDEMFPDLVERGSTVSNGLGWAAGRAAADLALLDSHLEVTREAG